MASAAHQSSDLVLQDGEISKLCQYAGVTVAALFPAAFWTAVASHVSQIVGYELKGMALLMFGSTIALFMASACAPLMLRD